MLIPFQLLVIVGYMIFRKDALEKVGGFDEKLPVHYDTDIVIRMREAGRQVVYDRNLFDLHLEDPNRFTLMSFFKRDFVYGYWLHVLYYRHPRQVGSSGWPWASVSLVLAALILGLVDLPLLFFPFALVLLVLRMALGRRMVRDTLRGFQSKYTKVLVVGILLFLLPLDVFASDAGKLVGFIDKARGRQNHKIF